MESYQAWRCVRRRSASQGEIVIESPGDEPIATVESASGRAAIPSQALRWQNSGEPDSGHQFGENARVEIHSRDHASQPNNEIALEIGDLLLAQPGQAGDVFVAQTLDKHQLDHP